jgi:tetrahydromethanopterin S-methyltransferase subunit G
MSPSAIASGLNSFIQAVGKQGAFAIGTLFGCVLSFVMFWLTSRNNAQRLKIDLEREKELLKQLKLKDDRINKLHDELGDLQKKLALPPAKR